MFYIPVPVGLFKFKQLNVPLETWGELTSLCFFMYSLAGESGE